jgi:hypothetical protein
MGREIRRVPQNWSHPTNADLAKHNLFYSGYWLRPGTENDLSPMCDESYADAATKWMNRLLAWENGTDESLVKSPELKQEYPFFWDWDGAPPNRVVYRFGEWDFNPKEATHYQIYETVSEGTPTSPVFASLEAMKTWLVSEGFSEQAADSFIKDQWAPSLTFNSQTGEVKMGIEACSD